MKLNWNELDLMWFDQSNYIIFTEVSLIQYNFIDAIELNWFEQFLIGL